MGVPRPVRRRVGAAVEEEDCGQTYDASVAAGADDAFIRDNPEDFLVGANLVAGNWASRIYDLFCRFDGVTIPAGATIEDVYLTFQAWTEGGDGIGTKTNIYCEAADDPAAPTTFGDADGRTRTTAFTAWDDYDFPDNTNDYDTPGFVSALQEVIDRPGWASGQAIIVFIDDDGSTNFYYSVRGSDQSPGPNAPDIHIQYCA